MNAARKDGDVELESVRMSRTKLMRTVRVDDAKRMYANIASDEDDANSLDFEGGAGDRKLHTFNCLNRRYQRGEEVEGGGPVYTRTSINFQIASHYVDGCSQAPP